MPEKAGVPGSGEMNSNVNVSRFKFFSRKSHNRYFGALLEKLVAEHPDFWSELKEGMWESVEWRESDWDGAAPDGTHIPVQQGENLVYEVARAILDDTGKKLRIMFNEAGKRGSLEWTEYIPVNIKKPPKNPKRLPEGLQPSADLFTEVVDEN